MESTDKIKIIFLDVDRVLNSNAQYPIYDNDDKCIISSITNIVRGIKYWYRPDYSIKENIKIKIYDNENLSIMMLMASFLGKLYGKRSVKRKKELKEQKLKQQTDENQL